MPSRRGVVAAAVTLPLHRAGAQPPAEFVGIEGLLNTATPLSVAGLRGKRVPSNTAESNLEFRARP